MYPHSMLIKSGSVAAVALFALVATSACSSSSTTPSSSPSTSTSSASASPSKSASGSSSVLPPIFITKAEDITVKVGDFLDVTTPNVTKVTTDNAKVLKVSQPHSDGSAEFNGGAEVIGAGKAVLSVYGGITNGVIYTVNVTAK